MDFSEGLRTRRSVRQYIPNRDIPPMTSGTYWKQLCWLLPGAINSRGNS